MSKAIIGVAYDGLEVESGAMDARELAPALLALSNVLEDANRVLNGDSATINVRVRSDFKSGSFEIGLELIQNLANATKALLDMEQHYDASQLAAFVGFSAAGSASLLKFLKWLRGRKIRKATIIDNGKFRIETDGDFDSIEVSEETVRLYRDKAVRKSLFSVLAPLARRGIDRFIVRRNRKDIETIEKSDRDYFAVPEQPDEEIVESTRRGAFNVLGVFFEQDLKWRLFDGENRINATIRDDNFLHALDKGEVSFTKGDILEVELRTRQWNTEHGLKAEHEIVKVIRQIKAHRQLPLPFDGSPPE